MPDALPRVLTPDALNQVLGIISDKRDRLIFLFMAETGARIAEALSIRREKIRLAAQEVTVVGKGNRERTIYLIQTVSLGLLLRNLRSKGWLAKGGEAITETGLLFRLTRPSADPERRGSPSTTASSRRYGRTTADKLGLGRLSTSSGTRTQLGSLTRESRWRSSKRSSVIKTWLLPSAARRDREAGHGDIAFQRLQQI